MRTHLATFMKSTHLVFIHPLPRLKLSIYTEVNSIINTQLSWNPKGFHVEFMTPIDISLEKAIVYYLNQYALSKPIPLDLPFDFRLTPPFALKVIRSMLEIPRGQVWTYKEMASHVGNELASRAVGNACRVNPFPLLYPCHRIVGWKGLGGFACGLKLKEELLRFEGHLKISSSS